MANLTVENKAGAASMDFQQLNSTGTGAGAGAGAGAGSVMDGNGNWSSVNGSFPSPGFEESDYIFDRTDVQAVMISLYTIVFCSCFFGNLLVILVVTLHWRMRSITNFCLANLAFADLCVGVFCVYQNLSTYLITSWVFGDFMCKMYHFINSLSHTASILILVVICVERYLAIIHPMQCKQMLTLNRLRLTIVAVWVASAIYSSPRLYYINTITIPRHDGEIEIMCIPKRTLYDSVTFDLINMILLFFVPLLVITVLYTQIGIALWRSSQNSMPSSSTSETSSSSYREIDYHHNSASVCSQSLPHPHTHSPISHHQSQAHANRIMSKSSFFQRSLVRHPCHSWNWSWARTRASGTSSSWSFKKKEQRKRRHHHHHRSSFSTDVTTAAAASEISYHYCNGNGNGSGNVSKSQVQSESNGNYKYSQCHCHCHCHCHHSHSRYDCGVLPVNGGGPDPLISDHALSTYLAQNNHSHNHVQFSGHESCASVAPGQTQGVIKSAEPIVVVKFEKKSSFTKKSYKRHRCTILLNSSSNFTRVEFHNGTATSGTEEACQLDSTHNRSSSVNPRSGAATTANGTGSLSLPPPTGRTGDEEGSEKNYYNSILATSNGSGAGKGSCPCVCGPSTCLLLSDKSFDGSTFPCACPCPLNLNSNLLKSNTLANTKSTANCNGTLEHGPSVSTSATSKQGQGQGQQGGQGTGTGKLKRMRVIRSSKYGTRAFQSRRRIIRMLIVIVFTFAICNLPFHARKMWQNFSDNYEGGSNFSSIFTPVTFLIMYANSGINPLLYAFMSNKFRLSFRDLLCCKMRPSLRKASPCLRTAAPNRVAKTTEAILSVQTDV